MHGPCVTASGRCQGRQLLQRLAPLPSRRFGLEVIGQPPHPQALQQGALALGDPLLQRRPGAHQGLMGDLHGPRIRHQQTVPVDHPLDHRKARRRQRRPQRFLLRNLAFTLFVPAQQMIQKRLPQGGQLLGCADLLHLLGRRAHRTLHRADGLVVIPQKLHRPVGIGRTIPIAATHPLLPHRLQREGQQWQRIPAARVGHHLLLEACWQLQGEAPARPLNHLPIERRAHGLKLELVPAQPCVITGMGFQHRQKVGAHGGHHQHPTF